MIKYSNPQAALAVLVLLALVQLSGCASNKPNPDLDLGGMDLEEAFTGAMQRVNQILGGINSMESAEKANEELKLISMGVDDLLFNSEKLSPNGQTALSMIAVDEASKLENLIAQVNNQPVIAKAVSGTLQEILGKIRQLI